MGLGNFTAVCTYIYLQCIIHLKNGIAREYFEILAKIFKVLSSRFGMVIYVFFSVFTSYRFLPYRRRSGDMSLIFYSISATEYRKITPNTAGHGFAAFEVGYTVKLTGYCPPVQVLVRRR